MIFGSQIWDAAVVCTRRTAGVQTSEILMGYLRLCAVVCRPNNSQCYYYGGTSKDLPEKIMQLVAAHTLRHRLCYQDERNCLEVSHG